ncbi:MAG: ABC transporter permease [Planctomycetota bacterium]|nr:MAG: ABC transporter permease [Planctomycetota bacterium]
MNYVFFPLETLIRQIKLHPEYLPYVLGSCCAAALCVGLGIFYFRKFFTFVSKSLLRNLLRTILSSLAVMVLAFVVTLILSIVLLLELVTMEQTKNLKAIVTERYQIPSQMPFSYAQTLADGAARSDRPDDVKPEDSMTWQFFGGTLDKTKMRREDMVFMFAMDPAKLRTMMDDLDSLDPALVEKMVKNKKGVLMGRDRLALIHNHVGGTFTLSGMNYKDIELEFEIVGLLPEGRYDQNTIMNRDYLNDALDAYARAHNGQKHPLADKTLNLFWLRVPDTKAFQKVADQVMTSSLYTTPFVKCETASSGIASFLDAYREILWAVKWLLVPAILITMALVIANAISISVRERRTEMAVLKVLGYGPGRIMAMVLAEAVLVGGSSGFLSALATYLYIHVVKHGIKFQVAFFGVFDIYVDALWWGLLAGTLTSFIGSIIPAWSARRVKVSEVFAKVG